MTKRDEIEARLLQAVNIGPTADGLRWLDQRVTRAMAEPAAIPARMLRRRGLALGPLAVIVAFVLLRAGAVAGGLGLLDHLFEGSAMPGWRTAWDRAERLDLKQTDAGVTITLERAYADLNQVLFGFTVEGLSAAPVSSHGESAPLEWRAELRDPLDRSVGQWATSLAGETINDAQISAIAQAWEGAVAPVAGTWVLTFTSVGYNSGGMVPGACFVGNTDPACSTSPVRAMVDGTWRFAFDLPAPVGTIVSPDVSDTVGQATVTLTQLRITPTQITARMSLSVDGHATPFSFSPRIDDLRHGTSSYSLNSGARARGSDGSWIGAEMDFYATGGADSASGTWEIVIPELTPQPDGSGPQGTLAGPWTLRVTVP